MRRVLVIGAGSIGRRHIGVLRELGEKNIAILRSGIGKKLPSEIDDNCTIYFNEEKAFQWEPTHMIICTPTSLHEKYIEEAVKRGILYFVEKPISDSFDSVIRLEKKLASKQFYEGMVGYVLRYNELSQFLREIILKKQFGKVVTASLRVGQYLPDWHPEEDYRQVYFSRKELGGGVLRTLSHEIDLVQFLFGKISKVIAKISKLSNLEIDVDDVNDVIVSTKLSDQVHIHLNYLEPVTLREGDLYFDKGKVSYSFTNNEVIFHPYSGKTELIYNKTVDYDLPYKKQMSAFLNDTKDDIYCNIHQGLEVLKIIKTCEDSNNRGRELCIV